MSGGTDRGFTLIEAVVSLFVLGLALVAALEFTARSLRTQAEAVRHLEAVALAEWRMNQLAAQPADSLPRYTVARRGATEIAARRYTWTVLARREPTEPELWRAAVRVEWGRGEFDLETVLYRPGQIRRVGSP